MTKYVYYTGTDVEVISVLKYKVVYENENFLTLVAKRGTQPITIKQEEVYILESEKGQDMLGELMVGTYKRAYFDKNPWSLNKQGLAMAKVECLKRRLEREIKLNESFIKNAEKRIDDLQNEIIIKLSEIENLDKSPIEVIDDTDSV